MMVMVVFVVMAGAVGIIALVVMVMMVMMLMLHGLQSALQRITLLHGSEDLLTAERVPVGGEMTALALCSRSSATVFSSFS